MAETANPAGEGGALNCQRGSDGSEHSRPPLSLQDTLNLAMRHEWAAEALGAFLALRLDRPRCFLLAIGGLMALDPEDREAVAETALADLRRGAPVPPFDGIRAEACLWADWASPAERKAYLAACWQRLPEPDRRAFIRAARSSKQAERRAAA